MVLSNPGTQHMSQRAGIAQEPVSMTPRPGSQRRPSALRTCTNIGVTVDGKVVVGRRLHHRAGVHRRRPQGQGSPLWPQWAAAWPLVPLRAPSSARTSEPSDLFDPNVT